MTATLCVALDGSDREWILDSGRRLTEAADWLKIGLEAFSAHGPDLVAAVAALGPRVFLDLKFHDIPNTVARAAANAASRGAAMINVHAAGGEAMMRAAVAAVRDTAGGADTKVIAVTVLTSLDASDFARVGLGGSTEELVLRRAAAARECGLDGVVASAREAAAIHRECGRDFLVVTPGIRPRWAASDDQRRIVTPADAVAAGADVLVVGRPITRADDPVAAAERVRREMGGV